MLDLTYNSDDEAEEAEGYRMSSFLDDECDSDKLTPIKTPSRKISISESESSDNYVSSSEESNSRTLHLA